MALALDRRLRALWDRLAPRPAGPLDALVTHCEVNDRHGTGVLLQRLLGEGAAVLSLRSRDLYRGQQRFGAVRRRLVHGPAPRPQVLARVRSALRGLEVRRVLCVPYYPDDVRTALAVADLTGAPLATWIMDDQNLHAEGIADELLAELLDRSRLRLAISAELRAAYQEKFGRPVAVLPPVVGAPQLLSTPARAEPGRLAARRGHLIGNVWGAEWLEALLATLPGAGVTLDWPSPRGTPWRRDDARRLAAAGLFLGRWLPEPALVAALRQSPFVVVPSGTLEGVDPHRALAHLSLPSRIPYVAATAGTPLIVLGHPGTAAARFVTGHGLGQVAAYSPAALAAAVTALSTPEAQDRHRAAAAALAPLLSAEGVLDWLWRSLEAGGPADGRFGPLSR